MAITLGTSTGDGAKLIRVGAATALRTLLSGEQVPARHPHVAEALSRGVLGKDAAAAIINMRDGVEDPAPKVTIDEAERMLVAHAVGLDLDVFRKVLVRAEAYLDPDGVEPKEEDVRGQTGLTIRQESRRAAHADSGDAGRRACHHLRALFRVRPQGAVPPGRDGDRPGVAGRA